jgi:cell wall-associated NlpC family hydrolase
LSALLHGRIRTSTRRFLARSGGLALALVFSAGLLAPTAGAATPPHSERAAFGMRATSVASDYAGARYRWGGTTPRGFDCSGYTQFVFARLGKHIPRVAQAQYDAAQKVGHRVVPGDLVFFFDSNKRHVFHVGIYAGVGRIWHAPRPGTRVRLERIWTDRWTGGRY